MSTPKTGFCLLVAALSACMTVGLYIHHRYVTVLLDHAAQQQTWAILANAGKQFDPSLVAVFLKVEARFRDIARQYGATDVAQPSVDATAPASSPHESKADARTLVPQAV